MLNRPGLVLVVCIAGAAACGESPRGPEPPQVVEFRATIHGKDDARFRAAVDALQSRIQELKEAKNWDELKNLKLHIDALRKDNSAAISVYQEGAFGPAAHAQTILNSMSVDIKSSLPQGP